MSGDAQMMRAFGFLLAGALCGCYAAVAQTSAEPDHPVIQVCDLLKAAQSFDGHDVAVSGVAGNSFHQVDFWDPECALPKHGGTMLLRFADGYELGQASDKKYLHLLRKDGAVGLTVQGRFISSGGPFGPEGALYEFLITTVVEVRKLSKSYRQQFDIGSGKTNPE